LRCQNPIAKVCQGTAGEKGHHPVSQIGRRGVKGGIFPEPLTRSTYNVRITKKDQKKGGIAAQDTGSELRRKKGREPGGRRGGEGVK